MDRKRHWDDVYRTKDVREVSWFQPRATRSLEFIVESLPDRRSPILDVGGGASTLVDGLLAEGYGRIAVLDLSHSALSQARRRVASDGDRVTWVEGDVLAAPIASGSVAFWHDRAVFHFLTDARDRQRYLSEVRRIVRPGGLVLIATFAEDGPKLCSGLEVARYGAEDLRAALGADFTPLASRREVHRTPGGANQAFTYCLCSFAH